MIWHVNMKFHLDIHITHINIYFSNKKQTVHFGTNCTCSLFGTNYKSKRPKMRQFVNWLDTEWVRCLLSFQPIDPIDFVVIIDLNVFVDSLNFITCHNIKLITEWVSDRQSRFTPWDAVASKEARDIIAWHVFVTLTIGITLDDINIRWLG